MEDISEWRSFSSIVQDSEANQCALMDYLMRYYIAHQNSENYRELKYINSLVGMMCKYHANKTVFSRERVFMLKAIGAKYKLKYPQATNFDESFERFIHPLFDMYNSDRLDFVTYSHISKDCTANNKCALFLSGNSPKKQVWRRNIASFLEPLSNTKYEKFIETAEGL